MQKTLDWVASIGLAGNFVIAGLAFILVFPFGYGSNVSLFRPTIHFWSISTKVTNEILATRMGNGNNGFRILLWLRSGRFVNNCSHIRRNRRFHFTYVPFYSVEYNNGTILSGSFGQN
jgi:hypothetical protein